LARQRRLTGIQPVDCRMAAHFPSLRRGVPAHYAYMFVEDLANGIVPVGGESFSGKDYSAKIEGSVSHVGIAVKALESVAGAREHGDTRLVSAAVWAIAKRLASQGAAFFEIVKDPDDAGTFVLYGFPPIRVFRFLKWNLQLIPWADAAIFERHYGVIREADVWRVKIPRVLGRPASYRGMLRRLDRFPPVAPRFFYRDMERGKPPEMVDPQRLHQLQAAYVSRETKRWGWPRRDTSDDLSTEYFVAYRHVTLYWAQATLREHIVAELNLLFQRQGLDATVSISGLPSAQGILAYRDSMERGELDMSEALRQSQI